MKLISSGKLRDVPEHRAGSTKQAEGSWQEVTAAWAAQTESRQSGSSIQRRVLPASRRSIVFGDLMTACVCECKGIWAVVCAGAYMCVWLWVCLYVCLSVCMFVCVFEWVWVRDRRLCVP